jgi:hypothetical protein
MKDVSVVKNALKEAGCDPEDEEAQPINSVGNEEQWTAARIMDQMEFIGDQITAVSISISFFELFNKISRQ